MKVKWNVEVETSPGEIAEIVDRFRQPTTSRLSQLEELYHQHLSFLHKEKP